MEKKSCASGSLLNDLLMCGQYSFACMHAEAIKQFIKNGIVVNSTPERANRILAYITQYAEDRKRKSI